MKTRAYVLAGASSFSDSRFLSPHSHLLVSLAEKDAPFDLQDVEVRRRGSTGQRGWVADQDLIPQLAEPEDNEVLLEVVACGWVDGASLQLFLFTETDS